MKKIICELCDGMEFTKDGGMFICQGCGTKYTLEEAKAMMKEVGDDAAAPAASVPAASAPETGNSASNQQQIDNLLILASNAFEACNNQEAEGYCNKIIEMDVSCYKAWIIKGSAICWMSTYGGPRVMEGAIALRKAVDFAPGEEKEKVAKDALVLIRDVCVALHSLAKTNFSGNPSEENRKKFYEFSKICAQATDLFNNVSETIRQASLDEWNLQKRRMAELMNLAGVAALDFVREKWNALDYPNDDSFSTFLDWFGEVDELFDDSFVYGKEVGEDEDTLIVRLNNRIIAIEEPIEECSYKREWHSWNSSYEWVQSRSLNDSAIDLRRKWVSNCEKEIKELEKQKAEKEKETQRLLEEARQLLIDGYWMQHPEEKAALDSEKAQLTEKRSGLIEQLAQLENQIKAANVGQDEKVPAELEKEKLLVQLKELRERKSKLGIFAGKEKKQISEEIEALEGEVISLKGRILSEQKAKTDAAEAAVAPLKQKKEELSAELEALHKRLAEIEKKLVNVPLD